jgi:hypothetical protein
VSAPAPTREEKQEALEEWREKIKGLIQMLREK